MNEVLRLSNEETRALIEIPVDEIISGRDIPNLSDPLQDAVSRVRNAFRETTSKWDFSQYVETQGIKVNVPVLGYLEKWLHSFPRTQIRQEPKKRIQWEPKTEVLEIAGATLGQPIAGFEHFGTLTGCHMEKRYTKNTWTIRYCIFLKFENTDNRADSPLEKGRMFWMGQPQQSSFKSIRHYRFLTREFLKFKDECREKFTPEESALCIYGASADEWKNDISDILGKKVLPNMSAKGTTPVRDGGQKQK